MNGKKYHAFHCDARTCKKIVRRYLDKKDNTSTSNLHGHAKACWGEHAVKVACSAESVSEAREKHVKPLKMNGTLTAAFAVKGKGQITYSHTQHTASQTRSVILSLSNPATKLTLFLKGLRSYNGSPKAIALIILLTIGALKS